MLNRLKDACDFQLKVYKRVNETKYTSVMLWLVLFRRRNEEDGCTHEHVKSDSSTVTAPAAAWLIAVQAGNMVTSMLPWGIPSVDSGTHKKIGWWIDGKTQSYRWHILSEKWEMSLKSNNPSAYRYTGLYRLVMDAITIHTCSLYLKLYITDDTPSFISPCYSLEQGFPRTTFSNK